MSNMLMLHNFDLTDNQAQKFRIASKVIEFKGGKRFRPLELPVLIPTGIHIDDCVIQVTPNKPYVVGVRRWPVGGCTITLKPSHWLGKVNDGTVDITVTGRS